MVGTGYDVRPDYRVDLLRRRNRVRVTHGDRVLADSTASILVDEQDHGLVFYLPAADVDFNELASSDRSSHCPFKGTASYWRLADGSEPVAWSYPDPHPQVAELVDHVAFYQDRVQVAVGVADPPRSV